MLVGLLAAGLERAPCKRFGDRRGCPAPLLIETSFNNHGHSWGGDESRGRGLCGVAQDLGRKELCLWGAFPRGNFLPEAEKPFGDPFLPKLIACCQAGDVLGWCFWVIGVLSSLKNKGWVGKTFTCFLSSPQPPPQLWGPTCADRAELWGQGDVTTLVLSSFKGFAAKRAETAWFCPKFKGSCVKREAV